MKKFTSHLCLLNIAVKMITCFIIFTLFTTLLVKANDANDVAVDTLPLLFKIEGTVSVADDKLRRDWVAETKILVNGGENVGYLKSNGAFVVNNLLSGSHLIEVMSPNYVFEKLRVDITKTGKMRARRANFVQPNAVMTVPYPLKFQAFGQAPFFEARETWKLTDHLFNPMVIMMVLPVIFLVLMPKLISSADPDAQKEMTSQMNMFNQQKQLPEMSDLFANWFSSDKKSSGSTNEKGLSKKGGRRR